MQTKELKMGIPKPFRSRPKSLLTVPASNLEKVRIGDQIVVEPVAQSPGELIRKMKAVPDFMAEGRGNDEREERGSL